MGERIVTAENIGLICGEVAATCDALDLESVIRQLEIVLKFARSRSHMGTMLDQRLRAAAADGEWNKKPVEDNDE